MQHGSESLIRTFNETARQIYFELLEKFMADTSALNREKDDNVFQMTQSRYLYTLKKNLDAEASGILRQNQLSNSSELQKTISGVINFYLNEFKRKCSSL